MLVRASLISQRFKWLGDLFAGGGDRKRNVWGSAETSGRGQSHHLSLYLWIDHYLIARI